MVFLHRRRNSLCAANDTAVSFEELMARICQLIERDERYLTSRFRVSDVAVELGVSVTDVTDMSRREWVQLAWNVLAVSPDTVTEESFWAGFEETLAQVSPLFVEQTLQLTTYQLNFIRAIAAGYRKGSGAPVRDVRLCHCPAYHHLRTCYQLHGVRPPRTALQCHRQGRADRGEGSRRPGVKSQEKVFGPSTIPIMPAGTSAMSFRRAFRFDTPSFYFIHLAVLKNFRLAK